MVAGPRQRALAADQDPEQRWPALGSGTHASWAVTCSMATEWVARTHGRSAHYSRPDFGQVNPLFNDLVQLCVWGLHHLPASAYQAGWRDSSVRLIGVHQAEAVSHGRRVTPSMVPIPCTITNAEAAACTLYLLTEACVRRRWHIIRPSYSLQLQQLKLTKTSSAEQCRQCCHARCVGGQWHC